jgi:hypothetical protein
MQFCSFKISLFPAIEARNTWTVKAYKPADNARLIVLKKKSRGLEVRSRRKTPFQGFPYFPLLFVPHMCSTYPF